MHIKIASFGDVLISRPAGKEAFLGAKAYIFEDIPESATITLDFADVKVLAPSWADEFITGVKEMFSNTIEYINTSNPSVKATLKTVLE